MNNAVCVIYLFKRY
jgi:hypothetical protein